LKNSEHCSQCGRHGPPRLYSVKQAAQYLGCCERKLRKKISDQTITYRRGPGGIAFTEADLIERLRPSGGPAAKKLRKNRKAAADTRDQTCHEPKTNGMGLEGIPFGMDSGPTVYVRFVANQTEVTGQNVTSSFQHPTNNHP